MSVDLLAQDGPAGQYPNSWYAATATPLDPFPELAGDQSADVAIIGAGYTGLSAAIHLRERGYDVALIEAQRVGWGASGRNGGQVGSGQRVDQFELEKALGRSHARQLWELAEASKATVADLIARFGIDCDYRPGIIHADHKKSFVAETEAYVDHLRRAYGYDKVRFLPRTELEQMVGSKTFFGGALDTGSGHLHPLKYVLGLARAARDLGVRIFERSRVTKVDEGGPAHVRTAKGSVRARFVLYACNGYLGLLDRRIAARVMPINSYIAATEPLGEERARSLIRDDVAVADSRFVVNYFRLSADRRMLFGGRESYGYRHPTDIASSVRRRMAMIYPQLNDAKIDYHWGGTLGITMNRMPHFARLAPNIYSASGYSGHGVAMASLGGQILAEAVDGVAGRFDIMAKVPTQSFPGGASFRRPLLVLAMLYFALRDRF